VLDDEQPQYPNPNASPLNVLPLPSSSLRLRLETDRDHPLAALGMVEAATDIAVAKANRSS
jgi:hypothetical protein